MQEEIEGGGVMWDYPPHILAALRKVTPEQRRADDTALAVRHAETMRRLCAQTDANEAYRKELIQALEWCRANGNPHLDNSRRPIMTAWPEWMPIESAPTKDGVILLYCPETEPRVSVGCYEGAGWGDGCEWVIIEADLMATNCRPTHWMPLPPAPTPPAQTGAE